MTMKIQPHEIATETEETLYQDIFGLPIFTNQNRRDYTKYS